jgi:hypothetical protein
MSLKTRQASRTEGYAESGDGGAHNPRWSMFFGQEDCSWIVTLIGAAHALTGSFSMPRETQIF